MKTFLVHGSYGTLDVCADTGDVLKYDGGECTEYSDIVRFDVEEWRANYAGQTLTEEDIVCIGFWTKTGEYEPALPDNRGGWHLYAREGKFEEDLGRIMQLLGTALYVTEQRGQFVYIRRTND